MGALDLADQASVAAYAGEVLDRGRHLDILIGNAGVMACPEARVGDGWELQLATNHLGHFALVNRLWPALEGGARVVSLSSTGHHLSGLRWDDPDFTTGYDKWLAYGQSKTANVLFAVHLDQRGQAHGVRANAVHPGAILTPLGRHLLPEDVEKVLKLRRRRRGRDARLQVAGGRRRDSGLGRDVAVAGRHRWALPRGLRHRRSRSASCPPGKEGAAGVKDYALDPDEAERLWDWSAVRTGVSAW